MHLPFLITYISGDSNFHLLYYLYDGLSHTSRLSQFGLRAGGMYALLAVYSRDSLVYNAGKLAALEEALKVRSFYSSERY